MHFTGTVWRPPYEADSLLLEATAGCTHRKCKFCTLYNDLPFKFKMSSAEDMEADLLELQTALCDPIAKLASHLTGKPPFTADRVFLTGANPFSLSFERLANISRMIKKYLPFVKTVGSFCRITDISSKSNSELKKLSEMGYDMLTVGAETCDDSALAFMNKGYASADILRECRRLEAADIGYSLFYLAGISGAGRGEDGARATAEILSRLSPALVGINMLTVYPDSLLFEDIQKGMWQEESELEKYREVKALAEGLEIKTCIAAMGASNAFQFSAYLPRDKERLTAYLDGIISHSTEEQLAEYRKGVHHL